MTRETLAWGIRLILVTLGSAIPLAWVRPQSPLTDLLLSGVLFLGVFVGLGLWIRIPELETLLRRLRKKP